MSPANVASYFAQVALVVIVCGGLPRLLALRSPSLQHAFWRALLAVCLLLPVFEPRQAAEMTFVPAPAHAAAAGGGVPAAAAPVTAASAAPFDWVRAAAMLLAAGIAVRLAWIGFGLFRLRGMRRRAAEPAAGFDDLQQAIGTAAPIRWSADTPHPVTFGVFRPIVLLPYAIKSVDTVAQRAVVAHELHHVKRRDWMWTIGEEIVRSIFWFHPAMWWLISRVQLARETVVDELSILTTNARRAYLDTLLAFADDSGLQSSNAFSARRHLFHRVMLLSKEETMSSIRIAVASCVLLATLGAGSWGAVRAFPLYGPAVLQQAPPPPPAAPPRDPQTREAYHALATYYYEIAQKDATLTPDQRLQAILKGIAAEDRALAIDPSYVPALIYKNVLLRLQANLTTDPSQRERLIAEADELRQTAIVLRGNAAPERMDPSMPPPPPPPPPPSQSQMVFMSEHYQRLLQEWNPVRIGGGIKAPMKIKDVKPVYPPIAQSARVQGVVIVEAIIDTDGHVADARVLRSIPLLDAAALDAVRQWEFVPVRVDGTAQPVVMTLTVNFMLQ